MHYCMDAVVMSDVQNFFLEAVAVIFVKVHYLYFRRKLSVSSIEFQCMRKLRSFKFFPIQASIEQKCKRAPLVLHRFVRHKYLREDHSLDIGTNCGISFQ